MKMLKNCFVWGAALAVIVLAFAVVVTKHDNHVYFIQLEKLLEERNELGEERVRLQIGRGAFGAFGADGSIEYLAKTLLGMKMPDSENTKFVINEQQ